MVVKNIQIDGVRITGKCIFKSKIASGKFYLLGQNPLSLSLSLSLSLFLIITPRQREQREIKITIIVLQHKKVHVVHS